MSACQEALQDMKSNSSYGFDFENIKVPQEIEKLTIKYAKYWINDKYFKRYHFVFRDNLAKITIFFSDPYYVKIDREIRITTTTFLGFALNKIIIHDSLHELLFIGNVGGFVGLLTGFSVISIIELFYHIMLTFKNLCLMHSK